MSAVAIAMRETTPGTAGIGGEEGSQRLLASGPSWGCLGLPSDLPPQVPQRPGPPPVFLEVVFLTLDLEVNLEMELREQ